MYVTATYVCLVVAFINVHAFTEKELNGTIAVVTGAAKGIGRAIANNYLKNGANTVIIVDKNQPRGLKTEQVFNCRYGPNKAVFIHGDITIDLDRVFKIIIRTFKHVDILVNNAGILDEYDPEKTINTNVLATVLWSQRFFEYMRKDKGGRGGTIMNVASAVAYTRFPFMYYYTASKYAILGLSVGMGHEYNFLTSGVRIFALNPGFTYTDMTQKQQMTLDEHVEIFEKFRAVVPWQTADDVGRGAALLYKTARTGMAYTVQGGAPPEVSPDSLNIPVDFLLSL